MSNSNYSYGPLTRLVFTNDLDGLRSTLSSGADPNEIDNDCRTPLIHAAIDDKREVANLLIDAGANVNAHDGLGNTALHYAAQNYHCAMVSLLIRHGATVDAEDIHGNTPLWRAVFNSRGRGDLIVTLLSAGADRNRKNKHGKTPVDLANTIANFDVAKFFN
jgi:ankyrin repeat protein